MSLGLRSARPPSAIVVAVAIATANAATPVAPDHVAASEPSAALRWEKAGRSPPSPASAEDRLDLDLDARVPTGPAIEDLTARLREEIRRLDAGPATAADKVARALRERAVLLLEARGGEADIAALAGLRLAMARAAVDRYATDTSSSVDELAGRRLAAWRSLLLERFADRSLEDLREAVSGRRGLDGPLARSMTPLLEAMIAGTSHAVGNHWPAASPHELTRPAAAPDADATIAIDVDLSENPEIASTYESWRLRAVHADLSAGAIEATGAALETIVAASHLPPPLRDELLEASVERLGDRRDDSISAGSAWIVAVGELLDAIDRAARRPDRSRRSRPMLVESVLRPLTTTESTTPAQTESIRQAAATLALGNLAAAIEDREIRRELRATRATLRRRAIESESRWISGVSDARAGGGVDRAATRTSGLAHLRDLERLAGLSTLVDRLGGFDPRATVPAANRARELAAPLVEPLKRSAAAERIDATLEASPLRFTVLDADSTSFDGAAALRDRLDARRRQWIEAWTAGDDRRASSIEAEFATLEELLAIVEQVQGLQAETGDSPGRRVAPWAAWWVRPEAIDAAIGTLAPRLALATTAWLRGDLPAARRSLQAIRETMPIAAFAIEVDRTIGSRLAPLPGGALGVVESLALPPGPEAWFPLPRRDLARLSLLEFERRAALAAGRDADAERLRLEIAASLAGPRR